MSSVEECKKTYGLGVDCDYEITCVEEYKQQQRNTRTFVRVFLYIMIKTHDLTSPKNHSFISASNRSGRI